MSAPLEPLGDEALLLRRVGHGRVERRAGRVKPGSLVLRLSIAERYLSFYEAAFVDPDALMGSAPEPGWGVVAVRTAALRELGFTVERERDESDPKFGEFHVAATPPELDEDGQIPVTIRADLAAVARVVLMPER